MTTKYIVLANQHERLGGAHYEQVHSAYAALQRPSVAAAIVNPAAILPANNKMIPSANYDCVCEIWCEDDLDPQGLVADLPVGNAEIYRVEELRQKEEAALRVGERFPGVLWFAPLACLNDLTALETRRRYDNHVALALRVHAAMQRYTRHWTLARLTPSAPNYFGFSMLHFATDADFIERHYSSPEEQQEIFADVQGFMDLANLQPLPARSFKIR